MPKAFTEDERKFIRKHLVEKGRQQFAKYGIKKTNVEDLARAVGISKGAFYLFYNSKEELFLEILEQFEAEYRSQVFLNEFPNGASYRDSFKLILKKAFSLWKTHPLLMGFSQEEYEYLLRKLPREKILKHLQSDDIFIAELMEKWKGQGIEVRVEPQVFSGLMKALFYVSLHENDFEKDNYAETIELLIELVANHLFSN